MTERHYLVYQRDAAWQFSYKGSITAPFATREEAIEAAIAAAQKDTKDRVEVVVQDAEMRTETIWATPS